MESLFGRDSPEDWLPRLRELANHCQGEKTNIDLAIEFAVGAWSMVDLVRTHEGLEKGFVERVKLECPALAYMQDVANKRKHGKIDRYPPALRVAREHKGAFDGGFSRDFDISRLELVTGGGAVVWFEDAVADSLAYWERHFASR